MRVSAAMPGWLRAASLLASAVLVAACTASTGTPVAGSPSVARQAAASSADPCSLPVANEAEPTAGRIVLGVISITPGAAVQPAVRVDRGWWRYWQKTGLEIRAGSQAVTVTVPKAWRTRAAITWGVNVGIVSTLRLPGCRAAPGTWNAYAGGFYLRSSSACCLWCSMSDTAAR
jgi:hypothetical protein